MEQSLIPYTLHLADSTLILSQRNAAWCGHGPVLEQDIALTNITLDLLGQSRNCYQYAADMINNAMNNGETFPAAWLNLSGRADENTLAYLRTEREFYNHLLCEQPNGDWGQTILRQYLFSQFQLLYYEYLQKEIQDENIIAITAKALKEIKYHVRWSSEWVIRLGDGTDESKARMQQALQNLWHYTGEMFIPTAYENAVGINTAGIQALWLEKVTKTLTEATLTIPEKTFMQQGGKSGIHSEELGYILAEMQYLQRTYPGAEW